MAASETDTSAQASRAESEITGRHLAGRYRLGACIAGHDAGKVYEAVQLPFGRKVAIKLLTVDDDAADALRIRKRFHREASIAARLAHPNIVTVFDYGETEGGDLFMAMEFVAGRSLYDVMREVGRFPAQRALSIAIQVVRALRKAHEQGVAHRDLKPANIMLVPDEEGGDFVKVLDFGIVKIFTDTQSEIAGAFVDDELTNAGAILGTPGYMAPEQAIGDSVDERADLYSVAVLIFQMVTGRPPFEADTIVDLIKKQVMEEAPFIRDSDPDAECTPELEALVHRCLDRRRDARPASARELLAQLKIIWQQETDESFGTETSLLPYGANDTEVPSVEAVESRAPIEDPSLVERPGSTADLARLPDSSQKVLWIAAVMLFITVGLAVGAWLGTRDPPVPPAAHTAAKPVRTPAPAPRAVGEPPEPELVDPAGYKDNPY